MAKKKQSLLIEQQYSTKIVLEKIADSLNYDILERMDISSFSSHKELFDYQVEALQKCIKILLRYFDEYQEDKNKLFADYNNIPHENLDFKPNEILSEFYPQTGNRIEFLHFINRMSFWMTTGSGKSIVIIKLIEILNELMRLSLIPKRDILFFTANEDLIERFKEHINEYNQNKDLKISMISLKEYESCKKFPTLFNETPLFYYKSDLMSTESKINIVNFRDYLNDGKNYIILDEAHKGDKQDSKRQNIFSILSQNGFLFNFSATFTDVRDIASTVYNLNAAVWTKKGYGKKIYLLQNDLKAFKEKADLNKRAKQKAILKSLILLAFVKKYKIGGAYHEPMIVAFTNSVIKKDSDLELFFKEIDDCSKNIDGEIFREAKIDLYEEFSNTEYLVSDSSGETIAEFRDMVKDINENDILESFFNSNDYGNMEAIFNKQKPEEIAFKLDNSDKPFALIKISDTRTWIEDKLKIRIDESFRDGGYFENIDNNTINILMGSRSFYEGWDSNRPNIMLFINIGSEEAKKFVTQAIGRGLRIESHKNYRQRSGESKPLETLFVLSTNIDAINTIMTEVKEASNADEFEEIALSKTDRDEKILYIPIYKKIKKTIDQINKKHSFKLSKENRVRLQEYITNIPPELFILEHKVYKPREYDLLKDFMLDDDNFKIDDNSHYRNYDFLIEKIKMVLEQDIKEISGFKNIEDEIVSFKKIKVLKHKKEQLLKNIESVKKLQKLSDDESFEKSKQDNIPLQIAMEKYQKDFINFEEAMIKKLRQHYYKPIIYSELESIDWIKNIISVPSEVGFLKELFGLVDYIDSKYEWWMFSKLNEHYDKEIYIPYLKDYQEKSFYPDFIFWLKKDDRFEILFIDPKGTVYTDYEFKIDGYKDVFMENHNLKVFKNNITVRLCLYNFEQKSIANAYRDFWVDRGNLKNIF